MEAPEYVESERPFRCKPMAAVDYQQWVRDHSVEQSRAPREQYAIHGAVICRTLECTETRWIITLNKPDSMDSTDRQAALL